MGKFTAAIKQFLEAYHSHKRINQSTVEGKGLKRHWNSCLLPLTLALILYGLNFLPLQVTQAAPTLQGNRFKVSRKVLQALQQNDTVPVIVSLMDPVAITAASSIRVQQVQQLSNAVLSRVAVTDFRPYRKYSHIPAVAGQANTQAIATLETNPQVTFIQLDETVHIHLGESVPALGANVVHNTYSLTGQNVRVAVLDTGIDVDHPDLSSSLVAQHCFSEGQTLAGDCLPSRTSESVSAEDENGHGSNVSGIITSDGGHGLASIGFAPDAQIVAIRVLDAQGVGWVSDWIAGLDWIIANQSTLQIKIINMSLGTFTLFPGNCDDQQSSTANALAQIHNLGITVFASSGNQGSSTQIASPACNSYVIAVGATYDSNVGRQPFSGTYQTFFNSGWPPCYDASTSLKTVTCFTNSNAVLDILAPGAPITSDYKNGGVATFWGTSQASPTAAGVAALMLQARPGLTPAQIEATLKTTGTSIVDPKNGLPFPLINALAAIRSFAPETPTLISPTTPSTTESNPTFSWSPVAYASTYEMRLEQKNPPMVLVVSGNVTSYRPTTPLIVGTYYWQVRALNRYGSSNWSAPSRALVINSALGAVPLQTYFTTPTPTLTWNRISNATHYEVQVANNPLFNFATTRDAGNNLSLTWPIALKDGIYFWHVRACISASASSCSVWSAWSAYDSFVIDVP